MVRIILLLGVTVALWLGQVAGEGSEADAEHKQPAAVPEPQEPAPHDLRQKKFYSWEGGKRWDKEDEKRKFYAWSGKRSGAGKRKSVEICKCSYMQSR